ncbi:MAG: WYL domain-containing protein [Desulfobacter sp.]|nr:MAG: WYL domain-containing protein [Desulfobacter sp.]
MNVLFPYKPERKCRAPGLERGGASAKLSVFALAREAITRSRVLGFIYTKPGEAPQEREAEPHTLAFKGMGWYLLAHCRRQKDFRIFKLSRMSRANILPQYFTTRQVDPN